MNDLDYNIKKETIINWLKLVFEISQSASIEDGISTAKMMCQSSEDKEIVSTVAVLYRAECSGEINPPIQMRQLYNEIVSIIRHSGSDLKEIVGL